MPHNIKKSNYKILTEEIKIPGLKNKKVLVLGAGFIGKEYCKALSKLGIINVTVIARTESSAKQCAEIYGYKYLYGGYQDQPVLASEHFDLVIIALPVHELKKAGDHIIKYGHKNILIEKPGSLYSEELKNWSEEINKYDANIRIRIAYNRLLYPNLWKLKELAENEGGITSCRYTFTEWIHTINFEKEKKEVYLRWGISNSLHVISMAHSLIGLPKEISTFRNGCLPWHPSGSIFTGSGITERNIPFSYHADWNSAGRWSVEIMTRENAYSLMPLEDLFKCKKGTVAWSKVEFEKAYPETKQGLAEGLAVMLCPEYDSIFHLPDLMQASKFNQVAENIFGYTKNMVL